MRGWRPQPQSASRGLTYSLLHLAMASIAACSMLPVLAALIVPTYWISPLWLAITIPLAVVYATAGYALSLRLTEKALLAREVEISEKLGQAE